MQKYYKCYHKDRKVRKHSSSGGAFTAISDYVLSKRGIVYGCALDDQLNAIHIRATNVQDRNKMRGSKYIESKMGDCFKSVGQDLIDGNMVLFSGTPCQVSGLKNYLHTMGICADCLLTLDVLCHGVGSSRFFNDYILHLEKRYKGRAVLCNFRAKHHVGQKEDMEIHFDNGKVYNASSTKFDWFYSAYMKNYILRESCYTCLFAKEQRNSDISIADIWGKAAQGESESLVVVNTEMGAKVFRESTKDLNVQEIQRDELYQPRLKEPCKMPQDRHSFWEIYLNNGYLAVQKWMGNNTIKGNSINMALTIASSFHIDFILRKVRENLKYRFSDMER